MRVAEDLPIHKDTEIIGSSPVEFSKALEAEHNMGN